jgi:hypothetical protein
MTQKNPTYLPPCNSLLWLVLLVSVLLILKKHFVFDTTWNMSDKKWGLLVGLGIVLFGLIAAWFRKSSDRVV